MSEDYMPLRGEHAHHQEHGWKSHFQGRKKWIIIGVIVSVLTFAIILGAVLGTRNKKGSNNHSDPNPPPPPPFNPSDLPCQQVATQLIEMSLDLGDKPWNRLAHISDTFGSRLSGSQALEDAIDYIYTEMMADGLENVRKEPVWVPHWVRGGEWARLESPITKSLGMLGLGGSVGTNGTLTATAFVVNSFDELTANCAQAAGKIVVFNPTWVSYGATGAYRRRGAIEAARCGAVAALVRSITDFSIYTPHTGVMSYDEQVPEIPAAAITVEDALMLRRMQDSQMPLQISLLMSAQMLPDALSHNIMGEIVGRNPNEVIVMGGHIDSWDVGEGSMDDLGGVLVAWEAVRLLKEYYKQTGGMPDRTVRVVGWTNEENGGKGADQYRLDHLNETTVLAIESDGGVFQPSGLGLTSQAAPETRSILEKIGKILEPLNAGTIGADGGGADVDPLLQENTPVAGLNVNRETYFWYHHTNGDVPSVLKPDEINACIATFSVFSHCVAQQESVLPRNP